MSVAILIIALIPSILPTWRSTLMAAGAMYVLLVVAFFWMLRQVDAMTTGEGPAFFGVVFLFAAAAIILVGSCLTKFVIASVLSRAKPATALWVRRVIIGAGVLITAVLAYAALGAFVNRGFVALVGSVSIWLSLITWLMPNNSFKPIPHQGGA